MRRRPHLNQSTAKHCFASMLQVSVNFSTGKSKGLSRALFRSVISRGRLPVHVALCAHYRTGGVGRQHPRDLSALARGTEGRHQFRFRPDPLPDAATGKQRLQMLRAVLRRAKFSFVQSTTPVRMQ